MIITRFAPSPTGYLHIGGARTALFNWLLARRTGGKFILRIEDTDVKRNTPAAIKQVIDDLRWLGIDWDEGPEAGGPNGPYLQSQRRDIYDRYIKKLLDEGKAYYCFETAEELAAMRRQAAAEKRGVVYRRPENPPTAKDAEKMRREGRPVTVRFAVSSDGPVVVNDAVRGQIKFEAEQIGDFIIRKSDGFPTYHFAVVIDDELMGVTDVIRGQEHLMNTPGHQLLQDTLGFRRPRYAHMSVTISDDGGKLSKRQRPKALIKAIKAMESVDIEKAAEAGGIGPEELKSFLEGKSFPDMHVVDAMAEFLGVSLPEINVVDFFKSGYLPETMVNFLALLGWSPANGREIMTVEELIDRFDIGRLTKTNSLFDRKKLLAFNTEHIKMVGKEKLLAHFKNYLTAAGSVLAAADDKKLGRLLEITKGSRTLAEIEGKCRFAFIEDDAVEYDREAVEKVLVKQNGLEMLKLVREKLAAMEPFSEENIEGMLRGLAEEKQVGLGRVAQPLRVAICGNTISPPIFDSVALLGRENTLVRVDNTIKKFGLSK